MLQNIPIYLHLLMYLGIAIALFGLLKSSKAKKEVLWVSAFLLAIQSILSFSGFYLKTDSLPPHFPLLIIPSIGVILYLFISQKGKTWLDGLDAKWLVLLHILRIPIEFMLLGLFLHKALPEIMTFEGLNFDILAGISAPFIYYFYYVKKRLNKKVVIIWNVVCLALLINILVIAIFSVDWPFQKFGFNQPNKAILQFPFSFLPGYVVPVVLFSHLVSLRTLLKNS